MRRCTQATLAGPVLCVLGIAAISLATACKGTTRDAVRRIDRGARVFRPAPPTRPFFRAAYGYGGTRLTPAREGARYTVMILQQTDRRIVPRLKARNRNLKVLMYVDMMASDTRDPAGVLSWSGHADAGAKHSDWFLRDANGASLVVDDYPRSRVMDVGNRHYQDAGVARVIRMAKAGHFDGVLLDDANASLDWVITGGSVACVKYPTRAAWQSAVYSFLSNVGPKLRRAGLLAVANIGGSTITPGLWQKWSGPLDGAMEESFTNGGARPDSLENGEWPEKLSHAPLVRKLRKDQPRPCGDRNSCRRTLRAGDDAARGAPGEPVHGIGRAVQPRDMVARVRNRELVGTAAGPLSHPAQRGVPARLRKRRRAG